MEDKGAWVIDIESSALLEEMLDFSSFPYKLKPDARLWCVVLRNVHTNEVRKAVKEEITKEWLKDNLKGCQFFIHHNGIKFDLITLWLFGVLEYRVGYLDEPDTLFGEEVKIIDTVILSRLLNPDRFGGHSLHAWGERTPTKNLKTDFRQLCIEKGYIKKSDPKGAEFKQFCWEMVDYCITPDMRLLGSDMVWKPAEEFKVGDTILGFDENSKGERNGRRYKNSKIEVIKEDYAEVFEVLLESGKILKVTGEHRFLTCRNNHNHCRYDWTETRNLRTKSSTAKYYSKLPCLLPIYEKIDSFDSGWLSGMFDGEGNLSVKGNRPPQLTIAQRPTKVLEKIENIFSQYGVNFSKRYTKKDSDCVTLRILGGLSEVYRTLSLYRPQRLLDKVNFDIFGRLELKGRSFADGVVSVKSIGVEKILKIQTSSSTFMCEGYPMHNCEQDTSVGKDAFLMLVEEMGDYKGWQQAIKQENKLADLAVRRESLGFWFDKDLAIKCVEDLTQKMEELRNKVNPILPPKPMTKGELDSFTAPQTQFLKSGKPSTHIIKFAARIGGKIVENEDQEYFIEFEDKQHLLPCNYPLKTHTEADISNLDHVKMTLTDVYNWIPQEWAERDFTKDSKKQSLPYEKRVIAYERWLSETMCGKYTNLRLSIAFDTFKVKGWEQLSEKVKERLKEDFPVRLPTSPKVRVGVEKELCPNLVKLGESVAFANDFALYLTYKHRKSSIAGGDIEDMDFDAEYPNSGFLSMYREVDGRVSTPAIEIGASTNRYRHIGICNIARASSVYGKEMRSLFGSGKNGLQLGYDFASLEARIQGHYCWKYTGGQELAVTLLAEKPNDIHTITGLKLDIPRSDAKSINYAILYGSSIKKIMKMLNCTLERATEIYNGFWESVPALKELKTAIEAHWESNDKKFVVGIDGRKINIRSKHSILNATFQSAGVIAAKYVNILSMQYLEKLGHNIDPFIAEPSVCEMIAYHDECQLFVKKNNVKFKTFLNKEEAEEFVNKWEGTQLSAISEGNSWYVALPNDISQSIEKAILDTQELLKLNVELGYEWIVHKNWYGCH